MTERERECLSMYCAEIGRSLTDEQREFASDFTKPMISISNPGTGKSFSIIAGLIMAQTCHGISGSKINAMSYTRVATAELKNRYDNTCKACRMRPNVQFNTFHSIANTILHEAYPSMRIVATVNYEEAVPLMVHYLQEEGFQPRDEDHAKQILLAIDKLNASMIFDPGNVEEQSVYKELKLPSVELFQNVRRRVFMKGLIMKEITQGDIPLYALYCLTKSAELCKKYRDKYQIMVVDEFQDFTLLYLRILSMISETLIAIGDMKQQIYGFNGSSLQIIKEYEKLYPNARHVNLTQSFRCKDEIAEYATRVYKPNDESVIAFTGVGMGGNIRHCSYKELDLKGIVAKIKQEQDKARVLGIETKDSMFLFRNNISAAPVAEELYKQGVLFQLHRFTKVMDMPIFKELCMLADIASEPDNMTYLSKIPYLFPEFKGQRVDKCPLLVAIKRSGQDLFSVRYQFKSETSEDIISRLRKARIIMDRGGSAGQVFNILWPVYERYVINYKWYKLPREKDYYVNMVTPIVENKTYTQMVAEEWDKEVKIRDCVNARLGVRCYTIHSAKGLEANDIYILDAEDTVYPSEKSMERLVEQDCRYEAALNLRNERNLLYVAVTRAKDSVTIIYQNKLTELLTNPMHNRYSTLDDDYINYNCTFDEFAAFKMLFSVKGAATVSKVSTVQLDELEGVDIDAV